MGDTYSTAQVCERFEIHRNTLFRWEKEGHIPVPDRNLRGEREFSQPHLEAIARLIQSRRHKMLYAQIVNGNDDNSRKKLSEFGEQHALFKFVHLHDSTGLAELREYSPLQPSTISQLLKYALEHTDPQEVLFWDIIDVVRDTSRPQRHH
jgi:DNA-binding transcriptional MerR regulator